eukprot:Tbor_TRINITY_DN2738_c0_g1::TRINITY_DN2738_c0_g1_i1::g.15200::m.15200
MIVPPNYGMVDSFIYRSSEPRKAHFPFLQTLNLSTCILLSPDPSPIFVSWLMEQNISIVTPADAERADLVAQAQQTGEKVEQVSFPPFNAREKLSEQVVAFFVGMLLRDDFHPILVCCPCGKFRTGVVCGILRKVQRWNFTMIVEEYRRFAGGNGSVISYSNSTGGRGGSRPDDEEFLETYDVELVQIPPPSADGRMRPPLYSTIL